MSPSRQTLLCAAEPWGYGPTSKLFAIVRSLTPRPRIVVCGTGSTADFAQLNADVVDEFVEIATPYGILSVDVPCDAVLTVMDPWAALLGARRGVPVAYVDSLFWFWNWDNVDFSAVGPAADEWMAADLDELRARTEGPVNWHEIVPMAYHWSTRVFAQRTADAERRVRLYPDDRVQAVGAVVSLHPQPVDPADAVPLVSVSGAISHLTPLDVASRYARLVREVLLRAGDAMAGATITGNPALLPVFEGGPWRVRETSLDAMHTAMRAATFLATPAGLTTALEAAGLGTPVFFLPEQHGGHGPNVDILGAGDPGAYDGVLLRRWFDLSRTDPELAIADLDVCYTKLLSHADDAVLDRMAASLRETALSMRDPRVRAERAERQRRNVLGVVGDFDGARTVARHVTGMLTGTATRRPPVADPISAGDLFDVVARLTAWHDDHAGRDREQQGLRVAKTAEEAGEALGAWFGVVGNNPRKGFSHGVEDVADELADTVLAALIAIDSLDRDPATVLTRCVEKCLARTESAR